METIVPGLGAGAMLIAIFVFSLNYLKDAFARISIDTKELTKAITALQVELKHIIKRLDDLPQMQKDIDAFHVKLREITKKDH